MHIIIDATDDDVTLLGPDVKTRDAVIVYPKGKGQTAVEVPLMKTKTGYHGDKIVFWNDLGKLNDEGTKIDIAIYDHDKKSGDHEELHVPWASARARAARRRQDENPQQINMGKTRAEARISPRTSSARPSRTPTRRWRAACPTRRTRRSACS